MAEELKISLPLYEGPLDLLLDMIRKQKLDIYDIPLPAPDAPVGAVYNVGILQGGHVVNAIAQEVSFTVDLRTVDPALRAAMLTFRARLGEIYVADGQVVAQYNDWLGTLGGKPPAQIDAEFGWYRNQAEALFSQLQSVVAPAPMANVKSSYLSGLNAMMESMVLFQRGIRERNETLLNQADAKIAIRNQFVRQALSEFNKIAERYQLGVPCFRWEGACA